MRTVVTEATLTWRRAEDCRESNEHRNRKTVFSVTLFGSKTVDKAATEVQVSSFNVERLRWRQPNNRYSSATLQLASAAWLPLLLSAFCVLKDTICTIRQRWWRCLVARNQTNMLYFDILFRNNVFDLGLEQGDGNQWTWWNHIFTQGHHLIWELPQSSQIGCPIRS